MLSIFRVGRIMMVLSWNTSWRD